VIAGVHDRTANGGTNAHVTGAAGLTDVHVLVNQVGNLADGGHAVQGDVQHLAGRQTDQSVAILLSHQLSHVASGANQLGAVAGVQLDVVDDGTNRDVGEGQSVAGLDIGGSACDNGVANLQAVGSDDVALDAVLILDESDESAAVGIVLQSQNSSGNVQLAALEVDDTVLGTVA